MIFFGWALLLGHAFETVLLFFQLNSSKTIFSPNKNSNQYFSKGETNCTVLLENATFDLYRQYIVVVPVATSTRHLTMINDKPGFIFTYERHYN